ncbi:VOC family protein [Streptomyces monticola]|uniref:VOC family protein n=1 Tax=Streptomyces monticola TaxID=2666263 RepID=A0ABW2JDI6_9ACTN
MSARAFPLLRTTRVAATAGFYERLGFTRGHQHPAHPDDGEPEFVALRRGGTELAVTRGVAAAPGGGDERAGRSSPLEMFVFVEDVDATVRRLRADGGVRVLDGPVDMPWGERVAHVADPDGNRVALASATPRRDT